MSKITDHLFIGSLDDAFNDEFLDSNGITCIVNVASELNIPERVRHQYLWLGVDDDSETDDITRILPKTLNYITSNIDSGRKVLIHCLEGKSRSVCVGLAYLSLVQCIDPLNALRKVQASRPCAIPWPRYFEQTTSYITMLMEDNDGYYNDIDYCLEDGSIEDY